MTKSNFTYSETIVGRKLPPEASYKDQLLAQFVRPDGNFCGKFNPTESWYRNAWKKLRIEGLIRQAGISFKMEGERGNGSTLWYLTEKGEREAVLAKSRVKQAELDRKQWSREFREKHAQNKEVAA
jgi:hypothetical protein